MRILTKRQIKKLAEDIACIYVQNIQENKSVDDCLRMNEKLQRVARIALGRQARNIPDCAHELMRRMRDAAKN